MIAFLLKEQAEQLRKEYRNLGQQSFEVENIFAVLALCDDALVGNDSQQLDLALEQLNNL